MIIDCCGDSTVAGLTFSGARVGPPGPTTDAIVATPAPAGLQALLDARYGAGVVTASNFGVSGTTAADWLNGTNGVAQSWTDRLAASAADVFTLCVGINDELAELLPALLQIIAITASAGRRLVLQTPNAIDMPAWADAVMTEKVAMIRPAATANGLTVIDFDAETEALGAAWRDELSYSIWGADGVSWVGLHPTQAGYVRMANAMARVLTPISDALLGYPMVNLSATAAVPGEILAFWTWSGGGESVVSVYAVATGERVYYAGAEGSAGETTAALPAGDYELQLAVYWRDAWRAVAYQAVTVSALPGG
jgi:lysophospholipase L1-like esterase